MSSQNDAFPESLRARFDWLSRVALGLPQGDPHFLRAGWADEQIGLRKGLRKAAPFKAQPTQASLRDPTDQKPKGTWHCLGPHEAGGRIRCLAIDPQDPSTLFAGAATGGVWRSDDEGTSWGPLTDNEESLAIGAIAIDHVDPTVIYAGTGEPYVRLIYPGIGLLKSVDRGKTWERIGPSILTRTARILIDQKDHRNVYCAGDDGLFWSRDSGKTWEILSHGNITDLKMTAAGELFVGVYGVGLFKREGQHWIQLGLGTLKRPRYRPLLALASCESCGQRLIYARIDEEVYCSGDGGCHWSNLGQLHLQTPDPDWASCIASHPLMENRVFVGGEELGFFQTGCGGIRAHSLITCSMASGSPARETFLDHHDMAFHPSDPDIVYVATDGGVFRSADGGRTWNKRSDGLVVTQFYNLAVSPNDHTVFGGGTQDRGTWVHRDKKWERILGLDGGQIAFDPLEPNRVWCQYQGNEIQRVYLEATGGQPRGPKNWSIGLESDPAPFIGPLISVADSSETMLFTGRLHVFREFIGLKAAVPTWEVISPYLRGECTALARMRHHDMDFLLAGTATGKVWWCDTDAKKATEANWGIVFRPTNQEEAHNTQRPINRIVARDTPPNGSAAFEFYVCFGGFADEGPFTADGVYLCSSADGKNWVWKNVSGSSAEPQNRLPNVACHGLAIGHRPETLYACTDIGVYRSDDAGDTWHDFSNGLPNVPCFDIHLYQPEGKTKPGLLRVATHGRGIWEIEV